MRHQSVTIVNWNIEWRRRSKPLGAELFARIQKQDPDIACICEGHTDFLSDTGHAIFSDPDYGYPIRDGRRKVALWSRSPWHEIDTVGSEGFPPGRIVSGVTQVALGQMRVVGVCIPWSHAHVTSGRRDAKAWDEHRRYLHSLSTYLRTLAATPLILIGDFNQTLPRTRAPKDVHESLVNALPASLDVVTVGAIPDVDRQTLDHVAISEDLSVSNIAGLSNLAEDGSQLSDHFGISLTVHTARNSGGA